MSRCLELAALGKGNTYPNPLVGSVITVGNTIIGEGFHQEYSKPHAEVNAVDSVKLRSRLNESTLYVNLEPCCHKGKTPPCTELIIRTGIPRIVIGSVDPNPAVSGKGIESLEKAGCKVTIGILDDKNRLLNRNFFTFFEKKRPYVILKWAESEDGFLDRNRTLNTPIGPNRITGEIGQTLVHKWRSEEQSIMVGRRTVDLDNPSLTARNWVGRQPLRITLSRNADLEKDLQIFDNMTKTLVYTERNLSGEAETQFINIDFQKNILHQIMADLHKREIQSILVEGGKELLESFIDSNIWDEAVVFKGNNQFINGLKAPKLKFQPKYSSVIDQCEVNYYRNLEELKLQIQD